MNTNMIAGHLQEKKGYYYAVLSFKGADNKRKTKWISTGLPVKGNKKKAEAFLLEQRQSYVIPLEDRPLMKNGDELLADYLLHWLVIAKPTIALSTYSSYSGMIKNPIIPWFREKRITLLEVKASDIQNFYIAQEERGISPNTVIHYHAVLHRALQYAVKTDLIPSNPADKVDLPRKIPFQAGYYSTNEFEQLFDVINETLIEVPVKLSAFFGLRRSEVMGLKWDAIDFDNNMISIRHTVTSCNVDGKTIEIAADSTKNKSSRRSMPMVEPVREMLLKLRDWQEHNKVICGKSYCKEYDGYICVNEIGERIKPSYLSNKFRQTLKENNLRHIRFHDLRHSCATLQLSHGANMKQIQEWLGHSDFNTTANLYAHLDASAKMQSAEIMNEVLMLNGPKNKEDCQEAS